MFYFNFQKNINECYPKKTAELLETSAVISLEFWCGNFFLWQILSIYGWCSVYQLTGCNMSGTSFQSGLNVNLQIWVRWLRFTSLQRRIKHPATHLRLSFSQKSLTTGSLIIDVWQGSEYFSALLKWFFLRVSHINFTEKNEKK